MTGDLDSPSQWRRFEAIDLVHVVTVEEFGPLLR